TLDGVANLGVGAQREVMLPIVMRFAGKTVRVQSGVERNPPPAEISIEETYRAPRPDSAHRPTLARSPGLRPSGNSDVATLMSGAPDVSGISSTEISSKTLMQWLHAAVKVLQAAADSDDFFDRAAGAIVDLVRLDIGRVLLRRNGVW